MTKKRTKDTKKRVVKPEAVPKSEKEKIKKELKKEMTKDEIREELRKEIEAEHKAKVEKEDKKKADKIKAEAEALLKDGKTEVDILENPTERQLPQATHPDEIPRAVNETDDEKGPDGYKRKSPTTPLTKVYSYQEYKKLIALYAKQHPVQYERKRSELAKKLAALK